MPDSPLHLPRRTVLSAGALSALVAAGTPLTAWAAPAVPLHRGAQRPELTSGIQSGDVDATRATVWTRADRTSRMLVEVSERPDFRHARLYRGPVLTSGSDFTGKVQLAGLRPGQRAPLPGVRRGPAPPRSLGALAHRSVRHGAGAPRRRPVRLVR